MNNDNFRQHLHDRVAWTNDTSLKDLKKWEPWLQVLLAETDDELFELLGFQFTAYMSYGKVRGTRQTDHSAELGQVLVLRAEVNIPDDKYKDAQIDCMLDPAFDLDKRAGIVSLTAPNPDSVPYALQRLQRFMETYNNTETAA